MYPGVFCCLIIAGISLLTALTYFMNAHQERHKEPQPLKELWQKFLRSMYRKIFFGYFGF